MSQSNKKDAFSSFGRFFYRTLLKGLAAVLPIAITLYALYLLIRGFEYGIGGILKLILPEGFYVPGLGLAAGIGGVFGVGLLFRARTMRRLWNWLEARIQSIPLIKSIYGAVSDFVHFFNASATEASKQVVMVRMGESDLRLVGFVTREDFSELPDGFDKDDDQSDSIAVFLPMSYQLGGYMVFVPRERVTPIDMDVETALRFVMTAGVQTDSKQDASSAEAAERESTQANED